MKKFPATRRSHTCPSDAAATGSGVISEKISMGSSQRAELRTVHQCATGVEPSSVENLFEFDELHRLSKDDQLAQSWLCHPLVVL